MMYDGLMVGGWNAMGLVGQIAEKFQSRSVAQIVKKIDEVRASVRVGFPSFPSFCVCVSAF